ncbi:MAG: hypothetical protein ACJ74D_13150 [Gaiellaceae bacterium]
MGLTVETTRFLLHCRRQGVSFERTATLGRQQLWATNAQLMTLFERYEPGLGRGGDLNREGYGYAEPLLKLLGAEEVRSFDASSYEGATDVHDFNRVLENPPQFTVVIDGGSLEHIFDVQTAVANCMSMVAQDGHLIALSPANNFFGHGFYQFSPEFFFRACETNGFAVNTLALNEADCWYTVPDPKRLGRRLSLANSRPTTLALLAKRVSPPAPFVTPQESDYADVWEGASISRTDEAVDQPPDRLVASLARRSLQMLDEMRSRRRMRILGLERLELP